MRIVVGVDGSETAETAALVAGRLAQALQADLHLLMAFKRDAVEQFEGGTQEVVLSTAEQADAVVERSARRIRKVFPDVQVVPASVRGRAVESLVRYAESIDAGLIVVGNRRAQGIGRILGSVARDVTATAPCDVYVAHTQA